MVGTWRFTGQRFCYRLTAEMTGASLEHDMFRFEVLRKKVSNFYFSERNNRRLFKFPRGEGVEFLFFVMKKPSTIYFSGRRNLRIIRRILLFRREEVVDYYFFRREEAVDYSFFGQNKPSNLYFLLFSERKSRRLSIF
jgi:hypothetical protein